MKSRILSLLMLLSAFAAPVAHAETEVLEHEPIFTQQELDQMLAPIALYPDALLTQVLMAATYPEEVVEAAHWSREHPDLAGDAAVNAAGQEDWDPSVISLTAFPQLLAEMNARPEWTEQLGDAFLGQQAQVMNTVQTLRQQAQSAGNLQSSEQVRVLQQERTIVIEQTRPEIVYVPYYSPTVVYGPWWWDRPPVYWDPWPGYHSGFSPGYYWGSGIHVGLGFFYSSFDWHRHHVNIHRHHQLRGHQYHRHSDGVKHRPGKSEKWRHNAKHKRNVPYSVEKQRRLVERPARLQQGNDQQIIRDNKRGTTARALELAPSNPITVNPTLTPGRNDARATQGAGRMPDMKERHPQRPDNPRRDNPAMNRSDHRASPQVRPGAIQSGADMPRQLAPATQSGIDPLRQHIPQSQSAIRQPQTREASRSLRARDPQVMPNNSPRRPHGQAQPAARSNPGAQSRGPRANPRFEGGSGGQGRHGGGRGNQGRP